MDWPRVINGYLGPGQSAPKRLLDRFSRFCSITTWPTDRQTHRPHYSFPSNRPHLAIAAMQPSNASLIVYVVLTVFLLSSIRNCLQFLYCLYIFDTSCLFCGCCSAIDANKGNKSIYLCRPRSVLCQNITVGLGEKLCMRFVANGVRILRDNFYCSRLT